VVGKLRLVINMRRNILFLCVLLPLFVFVSGVGARGLCGGFRRV